MTDREMVSVRLERDTKQRVEKYAEEHDVSRSTAIRRLLEKGADLEDAGIAVAASRTSGDEPVTDGAGAVVRPFLRNLAGISAIAVILLFVYGVSVLYGMPEVLSLRYTVSMAFAWGIVTAISVLPQYTTLPERIDRRLWTTARTVVPSVTEP